MKSLQIALRDEKAFTLIELIVVVAILGILAAIAIGTYYPGTYSANRSKILTDLSVLDQGVQMYYSAHGTYPVNPQQLVEAKYIVEVPGNPRLPNVPFGQLVISAMEYKITNIYTFSGGNPVSGSSVRARLSGVVYPSIAPSSQNASIFTVEELIAAGW